MEKNITKKGFVGEKGWYKGNLHCHTTESDGCLTPAEVVKLYQENGYHFLCISDHEKYADYTDQLNQKDFIMIPGAESSVNLILPGEETIRRNAEDPDKMTRADWLAQRDGFLAVKKTHHIHGIAGTQEMRKNASASYAAIEDLPVFVYETTWDGEQAAQKQIDEFREHGCLVMYNHPLWSKVAPEEYICLKNVWAIEIYNHSTVLDSGLGVDTRDWDSILATGRQIYGVASDDNHNTKPIPDSCGGWVVVNAKELTTECITENLAKGNFYASSGPEIYDWGIKDGIAYVRCSEAERINFICGGAVNAGFTVLKGQMGWKTEQERWEHREYMTYAEYPLNGQETYIRVECVDKNGKTAWTNALFL